MQRSKARNEPIPSAFITNGFNRLFKNLLVNSAKKSGNEFSFFPKFFPLRIEGFAEFDLLPPT
jgi:hypothetical protein